MITLNLKTENHEHEKIKVYLQENASNVLAEKINNGVRITKDGKTLISKKTLASFMSYAESEARKLLAKGARCACIDDPTVYGWAIHYFEEDSIEGKLYNEDGSEYQTKSTVLPTKPTTLPKPKSEPQLSMFDMLGGQKTEPSAPVEITDQTNEHEPVEEVDDEDDGEELNKDYTPEEHEDDEEPTEKMLIDEETGEVLSVKGMCKSDGDTEEPLLPAKQIEEIDDDDDFLPIDTKAFDPEALSILDELFGDSMILR